MDILSKALHVLTSINGTKTRGSLIIYNILYKL